jgi:uncharacterized protein YecE (DUF72 family)
MKNRTSRLTEELLALYLRYGPEEFEATARELREGDFARLIAETADNLGFAVKNQRSASGKTSLPTRGGRARSSKGELLERYLAKLRASGARTDVAISQLGDRLVKRDLLPTAAAVKDYMTVIGMPMFASSADRNRNIRQIAEFLRRLPQKEAMEKMQVADDLGDRSSSLQRWADIIVKPNER